MELKCPQCGKWMAVSKEELVIHDCQVVCPQCLAVCSYEGGVLVARDDSDAPYRHNAPVAAPEPKQEPKQTFNQEGSRFCHNCGKQLPSGISFCPYCGVDLKAPFDEKRTSTHETAAPQPAAQHTSAPKTTHNPQKRQPVQQSTHREAPVRQQQTAKVEDKLRTVSRQYSSVHPRPQENESMPGTLFKVVAYTIILALLALLVYIIIAGLSIEPNM